MFPEFDKSHTSLNPAAGSRISGAQRYRERERGGPRPVKSHFVRRTHRLPVLFHQKSPPVKSISSMTTVLGRRSAPPCVAGLPTSRIAVVACLILCSSFLFLSSPFSERVPNSPEQKVSESQPTPPKERNVQSFPAFFSPFSTAPTSSHFPFLIPYLQTM